MGTSIDLSSKSATGSIVLEGQTSLATKKTSQVDAAHAFLKDRFENRHPAEQAAIAFPPQNAAEEESSVKAFELMLDEKNQAVCEFVITSPTGCVAMWWGDLLDLAKLLPEETSAKVTQLDEETRQALMALNNAAPHRRFMIDERRI